MLADFLTGVNNRHYTQTRHYLGSVLVSVKFVASNSPTVLGSRFENRAKQVLPA